MASSDEASEAPCFDRSSSGSQPAARHSSQSPSQPEARRQGSPSESQPSFPAARNSSQSPSQPEAGRQDQSPSAQLSPMPKTSPPPSSQAFTPESASLRSPEQVVPSYDNARRGLSFADELEERKLRSSSREDPLPSLLQEARADPAKALSDAAWAGMRNYDEVRCSVKSWLESIADDLRSPAQVAGDLDFDSRKLSPKAFHAATQRIAESMGWPLEILRGVLDSNQGFLEHVETSVNHDATVPAGVTPVKSVAAGCVPSARKTDLLNWCDSLVNDKDEGANMEERNCLVTEATKRGIESMLLNARRALHSSSELSNVVFVQDFSDPKGGNHYLSKGNLCNWINAERIAVHTGQGSLVVAPGTYIFTSRMLGQVACTQAFLAPGPQGLFKRYWTASLPEDWMPDAQKEGLPSEKSKQFIKSFHVWMKENCTDNKTDILLNGPALAVFKAAWQGIQEFLKTNMAHFPAKHPWAIKLNFFRHDVLREARAVFREHQFVTSAGPPDRNTICCEEMIMALWRMRRQWHSHAAIYYVTELAKQKVRDKPSLAEALEGQAPAPAEDLSEEDQLQKAILDEVEPDAPFSVATCRLAWKDRKKDIFRGQLAQKLRQAFMSLKDSGLIVQIESPDSQTQESADGSRRKKPRVTRGDVPGWFRKMPLHELSEQADGRRKHLRVSTERFSVISYF